MTYRENEAPVDIIYRGDTAVCPKCGHPVWNPEQCIGCGQRFTREGDTDEK